MGQNRKTTNANAPLQKEHTYTVDGLIKGGGGLISRWVYIQNNIFVGK